MEPPHVRGGMDGAGALGGEPVRASMEPPHVRGGMLTSLRRSTPGSRSFNGAAACSRRNGLPRAQGGLPGGSASMEPPHVRGGMRPKEIMSYDIGDASMEPPHVRGGMLYRSTGRSASNVLQWSRRMFAAECSLLAVRSSVGPQASMEPTHVRGGMTLISPAGLPNAKVLQWSRRMFAAECAFVRLGGTSPPRFNGAAACSRRNAPTSQHSAAGRMWLQWS